MGDIYQITEDRDSPPPPHLLRKAGHEAPVQEEQRELDRPQRRAEQHAIADQNLDHQIGVFQESRIQRYLA